MVSCQTAAASDCGIALNMMKPHRKGDIVAGPWQLRSAQCLESGIYEFSFSSGDGRELGVNVSLFPMDQSAGPSHDKSEYSIFLKNENSAYEEDPEVRELLVEIERCVAQWTNRNKRADALSTVIVIALICGCIWWITRLWIAARAGAHGVWINRRLALAAFILLLAIVEICFRAFQIVPRQNGLARFMAEVKTHRILQGGYRRVVDQERSGPKTAGYQINDLGFRGANFAQEKTPGTIRIACVGDSFMFGIGVGPGQTFPSHLEKRLREIYPDMPLEILNFAIPGADMADYTTLLLTEVNRFHPDLVVIGFVLNDIEPPGYNNTNLYYDGVGFDYRNLENMLARHDLRGLRRHIRIYHYFMSRYEDKALARQVTRMYQKGYDPATNKKGIRKLETCLSLISGYYQKRQIPLIFFIYPLLIKLDTSYPFTAAHNTVYDIAESKGFYAIDTLPPFMDIDASSLYVSLTNHHPNNRGQTIAAQSVADYLAHHDILGTELMNASGTAAFHETPPANADITAVNICLKAGKPACALQAFARVIENKPATRELQRLESEIILSFDSCLALRPGLFRLINHLNCQDCAEQIIRTARQKSCLISLE